MFIKTFMIWSLLFIYFYLSEIVSSSSSSSVPSTKIKNKHDYTILDINVGSEKQSLNVLLDTTNIHSWWLSPDIDSEDLTSGQTPYDYDSSTTYSRAPVTTSYHWSYYGYLVNGTRGGYDTVRLSDDISLSHSYFGLSTDNPSIISEQSLSGVVALGRDSSIMTNLSYITMDMEDDKLYFGEYPNSLKNYTNVSVSRRLSQLRNLWKFDLTDVAYPTGTGGTGHLAICPCLGAIDMGSPFIGVTMSSREYTSLWTTLASEDNCDESTLECEDTDKIMPYIILKLPNETAIVLSKSDYVQGSQLRFKRIPTSNSTLPIFYLGRPFLHNRVVSLHKDSVSRDGDDEEEEEERRDWIMFGMKKSSSSHPWVTIVIILVSVLVASAIFFGVFWHYNKIPPPSIGNVEEQSLLPSQGGQQLGSSHGTAPSSSEDLRTRRLQNLEQESPDQ